MVGVKNKVGSIIYYYYSKRDDNRNDNQTCAIKIVTARNKFQAFKQNNRSKQKFQFKTFSNFSE